MRSVKSGCLSLFSGLVLALAVTSAQAANVDCPVTGTDSSTFRLIGPVGPTTIGSCLDFGPGNIGTGNPANDDFLTGPHGAGFQTLATATAGSPGAFSFTITQLSSGAYRFSFDLAAALAAGFVKFAIGLKDGDIGGGIKWAVFLLADGVGSGKFKIFGPDGQLKDLSHAVLYGFVPIPPALILFGSALVGLTLLGRRRRSKGTEQAAA